MRITFFGSGAFGLPTLRRLAKDHEIASIITQPDRPAGRGGRTTPTPIAAFAREASIGPVRQPERILDAIDAVRAVAADAWVVIAYGQKLPPALLEDRFAINLHASLLPRWRGAAPIHAAVLAGDLVTGNSVIALADRMDAGVIYAQFRRPIEPDQTAGDLHDLLASDGPDLVAKVLADYAAGHLEPVVQDETRATLAPKLSKADGWIDFGEPAAVCRQRVHGLTPWPGVSATHRGDPLRLHRVLDDPEPANAAPGTVVDAAAGRIACGSGTLTLIEVQPAGKRPMPWHDYANGRRVRTGETIEGVARTTDAGGPAAGRAAP